MRSVHDLTAAPGSQPEGSVVCHSLRGRPRVCVIRRAVTHDRDLPTFCFVPDFLTLMTFFSLSAGVSAGCQPDIRHSVNGGDRWPCSPTDPDRRPSVPRWRTGSWRVAVSTMAVLFDEPAIQRTPAAGPFSPSPRRERRSRDGTHTTVPSRGRTALLKSPPAPHLLMELGSVPNGTDGARTATEPFTPIGLPADGLAGEVACLSR